MTPGSLSYEDVKARRLNDALSKQIYGIPIEIPEDRNQIAGRRFQPILGCLCVQDSPENPCPCSDFIIWLPLDKVIASRETERRSVDSQPLYLFTVASDAEVLIEDRVRTCRMLDLERVLKSNALLLNESLETLDSLARKSAVGRVIKAVVVKLVVAVIDALAEPDNFPPGKDVIVTGRPPIG